MTENSSPRSGFTLPVFACASAIAALRCLLNPQDRPSTVTVDLVNPATTAEIAIEQLAPLPDGSVLAITRSDPGDNLDLTRDTPIWALVAWGTPDQPDPILIEGGDGIGRQLQRDGQAAIYRYATQLLQHNLGLGLPTGQTLRVTLILPEGRALTQRTSNAAFGVVEGLSLLGTSGISEPLSAPGQLDLFRAELTQKIGQYDPLVFCVGENGLDLAAKLGVNPDCRLKTANWLGPLLVEAGLQGCQNILLFGYHGKLIKLAAGIFHTHHYVADGRQEILAAQAAAAGVPQATVQAILQSETAEAGLNHLRQLGPDWVDTVYAALAQRIDQRSRAYIQTHSGRAVTVGCLLFDRKRNIIIKSEWGDTLLRQSLIDL